METPLTEPWYVKAYDERYYQTYKDEFTPAQTATDIDGVVTLLGLAPGSRILDLCCGFGRHSIELARRGYCVTGLDLSADLLTHARDDAEAAHVDTTWVHADMRDIPQPSQPYDAVISLFSSFGFIGDDAAEASVLKGIMDVLAPQGKVIIETVNREVLLKNWMARRWHELPNGVIVCDKLKFDAATGMLHTEEVAIQRDGTRIQDTHQLRLWTLSELKMLMSAVGLSHITGHGGLDGTPYTGATHRMVVIGQR